MKYLRKINKVKIVYFLTLVIVFSAFSFLALLNIELKRVLTSVIRKVSFYEQKTRSICFDLNRAELEIG